MGRKKIGRKFFTIEDKAFFAVCAAVLIWIAMIYFGVGGRLLISPRFIIVFAGSILVVVLYYFQKNEGQKILYFLRRKRSQFRHKQYKLRKRRYTASRK